MEVEMNFVRTGSDVAHIKCNGCRHYHDDDIEFVSGCRRQECKYEPELKPKEYKITPEQVKHMINLVNELFDPRITMNEVIVTISSMEKYMEQLFPQEFKPKREYCCDVFREYVEGEYIKRRKYYSSWVAVVNGVVLCFRRCPNCGQKPIPPID